MIKERIPISGDLKSKVRQLMEYAGWQEGRKVDISIAEKYYADHGVPMMKTTQRFYRKYFGLCCEWYLEQKKLNWAADFQFALFPYLVNGIKNHLEEAVRTLQGGTDMSIKEKLESLGRNSIQLKISRKETYKLGATRFGGKPDVPPDFVWPTYEGESYDHVVKDRPLTFLAQFNCAELAQFDKEHLLPDHGLLSFFYETDTQCWGYDPKDQGCARVYWFEDMSALSAADFPADMEEDFKFPMVKIKMDSKYSYPSWQDFSEVFPDEEDDDAFDDAWEELTGEDSEDPDDRSQLLGWPDVIQNSMFDECDLVSQGYYLGDGWLNIPKEARQRAEETARDRWMLLFQLDTVEQGDFELMFGDCGHIYFYITKEDLAARRFDRIWLILQCC